MKKQILSITILMFLSLAACDDDTTCVYEEPDNKALLMEQAGNIFYAISLNPGTYDMQVEITSELYSDISELLPISDEAVQQRGKARGESFGLLFYSISRNPGASVELDSAAIKFFGAYDEDIISPEMEEITKIYAIPWINQALSRNPGVDSLINVFSKKYLNYDINN
ncbi:MAG: hypothetical protein GXO47_01880 [Chlorobi bacterium]|nr:hypothetical protein [Chlorobiota bacterium]